MKNLFLNGLSAIAILTTLPVAAAAITYTGTGTGPGSVPVSASATFDIIGNNLFVSLINNSPSNSGQDVPGSTLTGLFWNLTGSTSLTPVSATLSPGSTIFGTCDVVSCVGVANVAGEFGYQAASFPGGANRGIASSGYLTTGLPGNIGNFNNGAAGADLSSPSSLDGINFGIVSPAAGYKPNGGLSSVPVIIGGVNFQLSGVSGLTVNDISNVSFQYGTSLAELNIPGSPNVPPTGVPEPSSIALLGLGLLGCAVLRKKTVPKFL